MTEEEYARKVQGCKGQILGYVAAIEIKLSMFLSGQLSALEKRDYMMFLLNKVNFKDKLLVFETMLEKNGSLKEKTYDGIIKDFRAVNERRNLLAHSTIFFPPLLEDYSVLTYMSLMSSNKLATPFRKYEFSDCEKDLQIIDKIDKCLINLGSGV